VHMAFDQQLTQRSCRSARRTSECLMLRTALVACAALTLHPYPSGAQNHAPRAPRNSYGGFVGGGFARASDDTVERIGFRNTSPGPESSSARVWLVETMVFVIGRIGAGAELANLGTVVGSIQTASFSQRHVQNETVLLGVVRVRAARRDRLALDVMGGAGTVLQHRETRVAYRHVRTQTDTIDDRRSPAFVLGVDTPITIAPHVAVVPHVRWYFLHRGVLYAPSFSRSASTRPAIGLSGRLIW
jgi:hypothetical protein